MDTRPLTDAERTIVAEEQDLLARAREAVLAAQKGAGADDADARALRALQAEYAAAGEEDMPTLFAQLHEARARLDRARPTRLPDLGAPYFGHLRVRTNGRARDVLLGSAPLVDTKRNVTIVEWRNAPIAEVFFACEPGDEYEFEIDGRVVEGKLERRHLVTIEAGALAELSVEGGVLRADQGGYRFEAGEDAPSIADPSGPVERTPKETLLPALDAEQTALVERDPSAPLCVLGAAGSGKTTVALHRVATLCQRHAGAFRAAEMLILVPEPGLRRLSERTLAVLGIEGVRVSTFDDWIRSEARRVFPWLPARESSDPPFAASRLKRHPALFAAIDRRLEDEAREIGEKIDRIYGLDCMLAAALQGKRGEPILSERLRAAGREVLKGVRAPKQKMVMEAIEQARKKLSRVQGDLARLVGDRALLEAAVAASEGELPRIYIEQIAEHTRRQLETPSEERYAHVDADRLATLDRHSLDFGTPEATAGTVDVEDYAILVELLYRKTGKRSTREGELSTYKHIVLDEAQELAPIELGILGRAIARGGSVTVAGDAAQRIDRTGHFRSWEDVMDALGVAGETAFLETSYRSPRPIVELAHAILGSDAPPRMPRVVKEGPPVVRSIAPSEGHSAATICASLRRLRDADPLASIAVIARDKPAARATFEAIARGVSARLVEDGDFSFGPGIEVTEAAEVKGLEFDYVVVPDASAAVYPDTPESRRILHVAVTRAMKRVWIVSPGKPTPILPSIEELHRLRELGA